MFFCAVSVIAYVAAYLMIVRFKVPLWVRRAPSGVRRHARARVHQPLHGTGYGRRHSAAEPQGREAAARREVVSEHEPT
jgi:hypothetical protein